MKTLITSWLAGSVMATLAAAASPACAQQAAQEPAQTTAQPAAQSRAQGLFGDVNPKLAQLTDDVLFGDVWKRPGLSPRDRASRQHAAGKARPDLGASQERDPGSARTRLADSAQAMDRAHSRHDKRSPSGEAPPKQ